ncbi:DUF4937 domain-containing protein [Kitasatospora aureofaciens]|uniref:DUF4937 domain-containing protein n=1 Tax=Kitasatospora aureofaciens TaxID=1894 RepID=UPI0033EAB899
MWIDCRVRPGAFDAGQRHWSAIADRPELVGQVGGGSPTDDRALLLGLWADEDAYLRPMRERHHAVATVASGQASWDSIRVSSGPVVQAARHAAPGRFACRAPLLVVRARPGLTPAGPGGPVPPR